MSKNNLFLYFEISRVTSIFTLHFNKGAHMKSIKNIVIVSAALMFAFAFNACTTDSQIVDVGQSALNADDEKSSSSVDEEKAKSSSSKKVVKEDDDEDESSSSVAKDEKSSSSADEEKKDEDSKKDDKDAVESSSSTAILSSSSIRRIHTPGLEESENNSKVSSSSKATDEGENSESGENNGNGEEANGDAQNSSSSVTVIEEKDRDNTMTKLDSNEQKELEDLINKGDTTITKVDSLKIDADSLDFENNEYLCKAPDGSWYRINENKIKTFWKLLWNGIVKLFTGHNWYDFRKVCDEIYIRPIGSAD